MSFPGNILDYVTAFWGGVLVSFTPCVYPIIPVTASFIAGVNTQGTRFQGFLISLIYVLGLALTYASLGIAAASSGKLFGQFQNHPLVYIGVANIFLFFALVMLDMIPFSSLGLAIQGKFKPRNMWSVLVFGMTAGLVVGPCTAPVLAAILSVISLKQNVLYGASLMFVFSFGVGASLILVGTFSGILARLPKSGIWLVRVKHLCGIILLGFAEYYLIKAGGLLI